MLSVFWSDRLENLADHLFGRIADRQGDPFRPECVVVNSPLMQGWLKQRFLFEWRGRQRVLANWDILNLYEFVNDWLANMDGPATGRRDALTHPYSKECLRWRIHSLLGADHPELECLRRYIDAKTPGANRRRFALAGQLARLFDDYQNYRALTLIQWEKGRTGDLAPGLLWQPALWNRLVREDPRSYLSVFRNIDARLPGCGIQDRYDAISVFGVSSMPPPYIHFFDRLGVLLDVTLYVFNPSHDNWYDDATPRQDEKRRQEAALSGREDALAYLEQPNSLLSSLGKGCQSYLAELLDRTGGAAEAGALFGDDRTSTLLEQVQTRIRNRQAPDAANRPAINPGDTSIGIHICHSPAREVEVLRDHILAWFDADRERQPRHIQVLVADMAAYAPYIDAVFSTDRPLARGAIPYVMTDRPASTASLPAASFLTLLRLPESRFAASEVMGLLETDPIRQAFGLEPETVAALRDLVRDGGIRWGADGGHAGRIVGHTMDDSVTWRRGLDRMLMGYAMGRAEPGSTALVEAGDLGVLRPMEAVEGDLAPAVGALCRFFDAVSQLAAQFGAPCTVAEWEERLQSAIDTFYRSTNENYREIAMLRRAVRRYAATARAGGESEHSFDVVAAFIESQFQSASGQGNPAHNAVLFSSLGTMRPTPRPILCLLGVNDGAFPRPDDRPTFDLMARRRHRGDRSARLDDRLAFLEAIMCARQRLHISYVGRSDRGDDVFPPSPVVSELRDYLVQAFALPENARDKELLFCETRHHLQAFHPDYFTPGSGLFSYSSGNLEPARRLAARAPGQPLPSPAGGPATVPPPPDQRPVVRLADLQRFFRNPAEAFFRQALRFRLEDSGSDALADTEMFAADSLASYNRETLVLDHLLAGGDPARLPDLLREAALIPLGAPGAVEAASLTGALRAYLDADCEAADCTVYELLARHRAARPQLATCELQQAAVSGDLGFLDDDGGRRLVFARYSETKPKDLLSAWLAHLLGTLASETPVSTLVLGQSQDKPQCRVMARLPRDKARETLGALIGRHLEGQSRLLPFAPHTSHDYVKALLAARKKGKPDEAATRAAVEAARKRWLGLKEFRGEIQDPHLRAAWGERGPVEHARFGEHAEAVWGPLLEAIDAGIRAAPGTAGEGAS